jgi:hypothetical protein
MFNRFNISQGTLKNKGFTDKKLEFYAQKKKLVGARFSASSRIDGVIDKSAFNKTATSNMATTPGSFFHTRGLRNVSGNSNKSNTGIMSKTFENFLKAKERCEMKAKERVDRLNHLALQKVKNAKKAELATKDDDFMKKEKLEKEREKFMQAKKRKDTVLKELA